jgi:hypothetical protein
MSPVATWVAGVAAVPLTLANVLTVSSFAAVGVVTTQVEQVPADEVTVLVIATTPAGSGLATVSVNGTVTEVPAGTATAWLHELPAAEPVAQDQPSAANPVKVVSAGTVSDRVVDPGLPPPLVTVMS